jgi:hypothetical protein
MMGQITGDRFRRTKRKAVGESILLRLSSRIDSPGDVFGAEVND